ELLPDARLLRWRAARHVGREPTPRVARRAQQARGRAARGPARVPDGGALSHPRHALAHAARDPGAALRSERADAAAASQVWRARHAGLLETRRTDRLSPFPVLGRLARACYSARRSHSKLTEDRIGARGLAAHVHS